MMICLDLKTRCAVVTEQWFKGQREPLSDYQVRLCDRLGKKIAAVITADPENADIWYKLLGAFQEEMLNAGNKSGARAAADDTADGGCTDCGAQHTDC
jgi:hypothetical protein